jgi:hypothetical protein
MGGRAEAGDADSFPFELLQLSYSGPSKNDHVIFSFHRGDERQTMTRQVGLDDGSNVDDGWIAAD